MVLRNELQLYLQPNSSLGRLRGLEIGLQYVQLWFVTKHHEPQSKNNLGALGWRGGGPLMSKQLKNPGQHDSCRLLGLASWRPILSSLRICSLPAMVGRNLNPLNPKRYEACMLALGLPVPLAGFGFGP